MLVGEFAAFIISFLAYKSGIFFVGLIILLLSLSLATAIVLIALLNFIFNRKSERKHLIRGFVLSVIAFGVGCGLTAIGLLDFEYVNNGFSTNIVTKEHDMKENLVLLYPYSYDDFEFVETDISNVKIEYELSEGCYINEYENQISYKTSDYSEYVIDSYFRCDNPVKIVKQFISNFNDKKITPFYPVVNVKVYASKSNIEKIKSNNIKHHRLDYDRYELTEVYGYDD